MSTSRFSSKLSGVAEWTALMLDKRGKAGAHRAFNLVLAVFLMVALLVPVSASASKLAQPQASVDPKVLEQFNAQPENTFWVVMREKADLKAAYSTKNWDARGQFVYQKLQAVANRSQAEIRSTLKIKGKKYKPFWIVNTIQVTADKATMLELAARPDVESILPDGGIQLPAPEPGEPQSSVHGIEWNIDRIRAPEVWSTFSVRGEGIVIANIDTGVQYDHPALVSQYRGDLGGSFDHNYNWYDPSEVCGSPSLVPCDNYGHGTHTMGTMVGDDGGENQIGVAPGARWIAAKGCESNWCSDFALLASAQWILAPTDLIGNNARPDLRPNIVNNSWGGSGGNPWYQGMVQAWVASGIFPAFSNGNAGPGCYSAGSPGDYPESYAAGAFDYNNSIASFSSRGPGSFGGTKPNIAAPGVDVRSSVPWGYDWFSGTSMASPHVAGTVALMWSAAPALLGDIADTRTILDQSAIDTIDFQCEGDYPPPGGDPNNVWGEGRLDAYVAVDLSPRGPQGALQGIVIDASTNQPVSGVLVHAAGPSDRMTYTDINGFYSFPMLSIGDYQVTVSIFAYIAQTASVSIAESATTVQDFALQPAPAYMVSGVVYAGNGTPLRGAVVTILSTPIPAAITDENGYYSFASVPEGTYDVYAEGACNEPLTQSLVVDGNETLNYMLSTHYDGFGYRCEGTSFDYIEASNDIGLYYDDSATEISLPFAFNFYGQTYNSAYLTTNGYLSFLTGWVSTGGGPIPDSYPPDAAIYPFWDDMYVDPGNASVRTELLGEAPNRQFVIEWRDVAFCCVSEERLSFEVVLNENGRILMQYADIDANSREQGDSATVGIENETSSIALQYSFNQPVLNNGLAVYYIPPPIGFVEGHVTDAANNTPLEGAKVTALEDGKTTYTDANGFYRIFLLEGSYTLEASLNGYETETATVDILDQQTTTQDFMLRSPRAKVAPESLEFLLTAGQTRTQSLVLSNTGQADLTFEIGELFVPMEATAQTMPEGVDSKTPSVGYQPVSVTSVHSGGPVLVFMDYYPWGSDALFQVLNNNGIPFDVANSSQMGTIDMMPYEAIFISSDQPSTFYSSYTASFSRFEEYVLNGGFLWVGAAFYGWNGGDFSGHMLPGGATVGPFSNEYYNDVLDPAHPTMQGVPNPFYGTGTSHTYFENLPAGTDVIARGQDSDQPTLVEYNYGAGKVLALAQTLEFGYMAGQDAGLILQNGVPYAYAFEPVIDIPWISETPASGTIPPGGSQTIQVTVNTTGLAPGIYRTRLIFKTNDPRNPRLQVPVTLVVPAYMQAVNAGGSAYTDIYGDIWATDKMYKAGSWGYVNKSTTISTRKAIAGTDDDKLYQSQRQNVLEYRFDGLAPGIYQVDLRFAELKSLPPNNRRFDIMIEGQMVVIAHDIALEVGSFVADNHTLYVVVTDGTLNIRFISYRSYGAPVINALRVTHRPDR